jgi:DNA-binding transcriptional MerR regulator
MAKLLTIGKLASASGVTVDTIRYYERLGLLPRPARSPAGYRQYSSTGLGRLALIRNAQRFGFSLREIAGFLRVRDSGRKPCHDVRAAAQHRLEAVDRQIAELTTMREHMLSTLRTWDETLARTPADRQARLLETLDARETLT